MTAVIASYGSEAALLDAMERLRDLGADEVETYAPLPVEPDEDAGEGSLLPAGVLGFGVFGAGFMFWLQWLSTATGWGYPIDIGGRPAFSWPAYIPITVAFGILCAGAAGLIGYLLLTTAWRLWDPVDEFEATSRATRDRWVLHVHSEDDDLIRRARAVITASGALSMRLMSHDLEEVPA
ncbi:MAG TPA: DUF3341 domain-containing protein [Acetobacteraceae bacterium]|nr:DUF3341 domain-containing protein [Acetobacteraceae bacterium]